MQIHSIGIELLKTTFHLVHGINVQNIFVATNGRSETEN